MAAETSSKEKKLRLQEQNMINSGKELHVNTYRNIIVQGEGLFTYMSQLPVSAAAGK